MNHGMHWTVVCCWCNNGPSGAKAAFYAAVYVAAEAAPFNAFFGHFHKVPCDHFFKTSLERFFKMACYYFFKTHFDRSLSQIQVKDRRRTSQAGL